MADDVSLTFAELNNREAPDQMLPRHALLNVCHGAGINLGSVCLYLTYSECLERVRPGVFAPRGAVTDRGSPWSPPPKEPAGGVAEPVSTGDGTVTFSVRVTVSDWANGVMHLSGPLRAALAGQRFACTDQSGQPVGTMAVDHHGNSWGWTSFLKASGGGPGDVVVVTLDLRTSTGVPEHGPSAASGEPADGAPADGC